MKPRIRYIPDHAIDGWEFLGVYQLDYWDTKLGRRRLFFDIRQVAFDFLEMKYKRDEVLR